MEKFRHILFDLDGTLTDPSEGITNSIMYAQKKMGLEPWSRAELLKFIGPPLLESFSVYCGLSDGDCRRAVTYYREYFTERGIFENTVYDGIPKLLTELSAVAKLSVATSKPEPFARRITEHFGLDAFFTFVGGSSMDETRTEKAEVIGYVMKELRATCGETLMVGDRKHDIIGAGKNGIAAVGVLFGFGTRAELEAAGADFIAEGVEDTRRLLLSLV